MAENADVEKRGIVVLNFSDGEPDPQCARWTPNICACSPIRLEAAHLCHDNNSLITKTMESVLVFLAGMFIRVRCRSHYGKSKSGGGGTMVPITF